MVDIYQKLDSGFSVYGNFFQELVSGGSLAQGLRTPPFCKAENFHCRNVLGPILPLREICRRAAQAGELVQVRC